MCLELMAICTRQGDIAEVVVPHILLCFTGKVLKIVEHELCFCGHFAALHVRA